MAIKSDGLLRDEVRDSEGNHATGCESEAGEGHGDPLKAVATSHVVNGVLRRERGIGILIFH